jgi:RND family efflux transporter MFP subunit
VFVLPEQNISMNALYRKHRWLAQFQGANGPRFRQLAILSALSIAALANGCGRKEVSGNQGAPAVPVKTVVIQPVPITDASEYLATLKSRHSTALNPQVEGQVTQILVKSGNRVTAGTPLMQIDPLKQQATVGSQEAARAAQLANVHFAQIQWERVKKLYDAGVVSKQDFDQAQTSLDTAKQQLRSLDAQVRQQQVELHYYRVVAPTDGIVGDIPVRIGERVTTSTLLTTVDEPGSLELYVSVPVERSKDLRLGQTVQLLDNAGNLAGESRIEFISAEVDNNTQSILVKARVKNSSGALRTSQFARARIIWGVHQGLVIPMLAVSRINGQFFIFVVEGSGKSLVAHQKMLRLGEMTGNQYVVLYGIKAGDRVVVQGAQNLIDGVSVTETSQNSSAKPSS